MSTVIPAPSTDQCHEAAQYCARTYDGGIDQPTRSRVLSGIRSLLSLHDILGTEYFALCYMVSLLSILERNHQNKTESKHNPAISKQSVADAVNHPQHYTGHPSGVECITIAEHFGFSLGNAIKYIWRADEKRDAIEDLRKARWYLDREIARREKRPER